ncbi:hypothetical protein MLD38_005002 [Melastoma candidum]|uniref:Uncharacterized protein n=1 Tax=Melastoma candidum TaxID=119954 RepID=A0ACB9S8T4_9MYRT|nr:hypothetical protein MLD38_005002 [Melastoma candidum]
MLKMAILVSTTPVLITELEKRIGMKMEHADLDDLLIPSYRKAEQALPMNSPESLMYDVDAVQRIIEYFLMYKNQQQPQDSGLYVSKLLDNYLVEIARDPNLSITRFQVLAESLPESTRSCDDGLYRAIDTYLKSHPLLSDYDRRRLCKIINCRKLSVDACMHAAQNDRLSLRTIIQVLLSEQVKMRAAIQEKEVGQRESNSENDEKQTSTDIEIKILRAELESVKAKMAELQSDYSELQQKHEKISNKQRRASIWVSRWKKIRTSLHKKVNEEEMGEDKEIPGQFGSRASFVSRTRMSIS